MHSKFSTRSLLAALAVLILTACVYLLFSALTGGSSAREGMVGNAPQLTVEEKAAVLRSLTQTSDGEATVTPSEAAERLRTLESVAQSSSDSPAAQQSDAEKAKILESLQSQ
jgi:hypothetical protein